MSFYQQIAPYYHHIFKLNQAQVTFIKAFIPKKDAFIVDVGCGIGTLSFEMARVYTNVIGLDIDAEMIGVASQRKENEQSIVSFIQGGMLDVTQLFKPKSVDTLVCFGNTLPHLNSLEEVQLFFQLVKTILKEDGKLVMQLVNYNSILANNTESLPVIENEEIRFERNYGFKNNVQKIDFLTRLTVKANNTIINNSVELLAVLQEDIEKALLHCGFEHIQCFGSFTKETYKPKESPALIVVAW